MYIHILNNWDEQPIRSLRPSQGQLDLDMEADFEMKTLSMCVELLELDHFLNISASEQLTILIFRLRSSKFLCLICRFLVAVSIIVFFCG